MVVYYIYRLLEGLLRRLPLTLCWRIGAIIGGAVYAVMPGYRELVLRNLTIAYGREKSAQELQALARAHLCTLGGNLLCALKMPWMSPARVESCITMEGEEVIAQATSAGKGVIYALLHMGNWEVLTQLPALSPGVLPAAIFQPLGNARLNAHIRRMRERNGCRLFDRHDGFSGPAQWLREGNNIGILLDQHAGDGGVWVPFFGRLASSTNLGALLSRRTGAAVITLSVITLGPARWKVVASGSAPLPTDVSAATAILTSALENVVRQSPVDWFWVHNRWKTPNPDFLLTNYKRGITLPAGMTAEQLQPFEIIIRSPNWLGDACMAVPAVRAIKRGRPDARITILSPAKIAPLWELIPDVDAVLPIPAKAGVFKTAALIKATGRSYDAGILLPNSLRSALELKLAQLPRIVGYQGHHRKWLLHQIIPPKKKAGPLLHHTRHYLRIAWRLEADVECPTLHDPLPHTAAPAPADGTLTLGLCPGAEYGSAKRYPAERYIEAAKKISAQVACRWVVFGTAAETALGETIATGIGAERCTNLAGKTTLPELFAQLRSCRLLLTNDTGTMHLAALLGTPVVAIFGSTEPAATGPLGASHRVIRRHVDCSPCFLRECPLDFRCMKEIDPAQVAREVCASLGHT